MYDYLIVGAGLYGSVFAWRAKLDGKRCLVIDKRNHLGGNLYCEEINGILVHKYGPHIFHTSNKKTWDFVNLFTEFKPFTLQTIANYNGLLYNLPFNMNTFYLLWKTRTPEEAKKIIESLKYKGVITNLEEQALALVGKDVYTTLIKGYTEKQWGCKCSLLPPYIIKRIPLRFNFDNNYFNDIYCGVGNYNKLISGLLEDIDYLLETDFFTLKGIEFNKLVYTGPIDRYFDYMFGPLRWRSLRWETETLETENYQGVPIMNFTGEEPYTRIVEYKHFLSKSSPNTVIVKEFPTSTGDPYYPVDLDNPYSLITEPNVIFGGRLGSYKYYNMDLVIKLAIYDYSRRG